MFPVPALTATQVLDEALEVNAGDRLLVNGAGGVTGPLLVSLASLRGAEVVATAGPESRQPITTLGARYVVDYHEADWPAQVLVLTGGSGVTAAVNAAACGATDAVRAVADGGRWQPSRRTRPAGAGDHGLEHLRETGRWPVAETRATARGWTARGLTRADPRTSRRRRCACDRRQRSCRWGGRAHALELQAITRSSRPSSGGPGAGPGTRRGTLGISREPGSPPVRLADLLIDGGYQLAELLPWGWRAVAADLAYQIAGSPA